MNRGNDYIQKFNSIINNNLDSILNIKHVVGRQIKLHGFRYVKFANQYKIECGQRQCKKILSISKASNTIAYKFFLVGRIF